MRTGRRYTTPLLYLSEGDDLVVIASNGGSDRDPRWWRNLVANPHTQVRVRDRRRHVRAEAARGEQRTRLWSKITSQYPIYRSYERRASREIPVVMLRPE